MRISVNFALFRRKRWRWSGKLQLTVNNNTPKTSDNVMPERRLNDLVQETFLEAHRHFALFHGRSAAEFALRPMAY
jgi:hypothetical protein